MKKPKIIRSEVLDMVKKRAEERRNFTFRLETTLMASFVKLCEKEQVKPTWILEELMRQFIGKN